MKLPIRSKMKKEEVYFIISRLNGFALCAESSSLGALAVTKPIDPLSSLQKWTYTNNKTLKLNTKEGYVLDIKGSKKEPGTGLALWEENDGVNQKFDISPEGSIVALLNGLCLDIAEESVAENAKVIMYNQGYQVNQLWTFIPFETFTREKLEEINAKHKAIRKQSFSEFCMEVEINNLSSNLVYEPELYFGDGTMDVVSIIEPEESTSSRFYSKNTSGELSGILCYSIKGSETRLAILFYMKESSLFSQKYWIANAVFLTEVDAIDQKLFKELFNSKTKIELSEKTVNVGKLSVNSRYHQVNLRLSKGNKCLIHVEIKDK